jgi:phospholipid/cholesterol/gamma-HCH transport system ATP-binding protein
MKEESMAPADKRDRVIRISGLEKGFGSHRVLKGVNLEVGKGENIVVLGKSGTGKSVLIKCIAGLLTPDAGKLEVLGQDVPSLPGDDLNELRKKIGFLFQGGALYDSMTVRENLEFPLRKTLKGLPEEEIDKKVLEALENVGLKEAIDKMPSELSGGMRKRIALARTLIMNPEIMLYDEPTTGLDTITSREISELIVDMQKKYNTSSIIITHDMSCARITSNRIVVLSEGVYIAEGSYEELAGSEDDNVNAFFKG